MLNFPAVSGKLIEADCLARLATSIDMDMLFHTLDQMPSEAKGAYCLDRIQLPSIRIRYDKASFFG